MPRVRSGWQDEVPNHRFSCTAVILRPVFLLSST